jgi:energy-coupling factor transport system permease protein
MLAFAAAVAGAAFVSPPPEGPLIVLAAVTALALISGLSRAVLAPAAVVSAPFWFFLFLIHAVFADPGHGGAVSLGEIELSRDGLLTTVTAGSRISALVAGFLLTLAVTHPGRLVEALVERGWSVSVAYLLAATLQAVPQFRTRAAQIIEAQRCRGLDPRRGVLGRWRALQALALPLVLSALHDVDERTLALESRALGTARRTALAPPADSFVQVGLRWLLILGVAAGIAARILW